MPFFSSQPMQIRVGKNALVCTCRQDSVEIDMRPFMRAFRPQEYDVWYNYWYSERVVKKPKKVTHPKRQPIHDGSPIEKKKRRTKQTSKGARGPHIEETGGSSQYYMDEMMDSLSPKSSDAWKKRVMHLWSNLPLNFMAEKDFNDRQALDYPHCCVCQYFVPKSLLHRSDGIPYRSHRLLSKNVFAKVNPDSSSLEENAGADRLFRCNNCFIVVHQGCYPIVRSADASTWKCLRCRQKDENVSCHLCELRGGALIPAIDSSNDFVHVICALLNRRTLFLNPGLFDAAYTWPIPKFRAPIKYRELIDSEYVNALPSFNEEGKFECDYCLHSREGLVKCCMCDDALFHATCGRMAGVFFEFRNWPDLAVAVCPQHNEAPVDSAPLSIGDKVRASIDGIRGLVKAEVVDIEKMDSCTVSFMDRNWSDDLPPCDIIDCQCARLNCNGWHIPGAKIKIKWDDGLVYDGIFRNRYDKEMYVLKLLPRNANNPTVVKLGREVIFARGEKPSE